MNNSPLNALTSLDFNSPAQLIATGALLALLFFALRTIYKEVRRLFRKANRSYGKLVAAGLITTGSGGALTDAFGIPSDIINHLGMGGLFF